jgi:hypothetical protein
LFKFLQIQMRSSTASNAITNGIGSTIVLSRSGNFALIERSLQWRPHLVTWHSTACHNQSVRCSVQKSSQLISRLESLLDGPTGLAWLRSIARRQKSQPWQPIKCGPSMEPASVHIKRFRDQWAAAIRASAAAYPAAASDCAALLALDPLRQDSDSAISAAIAAIRRLSDPGVVRSMEREAKRDEFRNRLSTLRKERGWSLGRLARECGHAARRLGFGMRAPDRYQLMDYESGRSNAHARTKLVLAAALGVALDHISA